MTRTDRPLTDLTVTGYLRAINSYPLLSAEEETCLAHEMAEGARAGRKLAKLRQPPHPEVTLQEAVLERQVRAGLAARQRLVESNFATGCFDRTPLSRSRA
jgi:hypothetical protein